MAELIAITRQTSSLQQQRSGGMISRPIDGEEDSIPPIQWASRPNPAATIPRPNRVFISKGLFFDRGLLLLMAVSVAVVALTTQLFLSDLSGDTVEPSFLAQSVQQQMSRTSTAPATSAAFVQSLTLREQRLLLHKSNFVAQLIKANGRPSIDSQLLARVVVAEGRRNNIDPILVLSVIQSESTFDHRAVSHKGAMGLMQVMPGTADHIHTAMLRSKSLVKPLLDPENNIRLGVIYLQYLQRMFNGDLRTALVAYNWGPGNVKKALKNKTNFPSGPRHYAEKILQRHADWRAELDVQLAQNDSAASFVG